jgi:PKD repeat protein
MVDRLRSIVFFKNIPSKECRGFHFYFRTIVSCQRNSITLIPQNKRHTMKIHAYLIAGLFLLSLSCSKDDDKNNNNNSGGGNNQPQDIVAEFSGDPMNVLVGDTVTFTDLSSLPSMLRYWTFEGGNPPISSDSIVEVVYSQPGNFSVTLEVATATSIDSIAKSNYISVTSPALFDYPRFNDFDVSYDVTYGLDPAQHRLNLFVPKNDTRSNRPVILLFGGGAFNGSNLVQMEDLAEQVASYGAVVALCRYRSGPTGTQVQTSQRLVEGNQDTKAAIRYFKANADIYGIDTNLIFNGGYATGGFIALFASYVDMNELDANSQAFVNSLGGLNGTQGNPGYGSEAAGVISLAGGMFQSLDNIDATDIPVFAAHGDMDMDVPIDSAGNEFGGRAVVQKALSVGLDAELVVLQGGDHSTPTDNPELYVQDLIDWLLTRI